MYYQNNGGSLLDAKIINFWLNFRRNSTARPLSSTLDGIMNEENFRLYVGGDISHYRTMEEAKDAARPFMPKMPELRIEILKEIDLSEADWWAYNYETKEWEPS